MKKETYFPFFISSWSKTPRGVEISTTTNTISLEGMSVKTMSQLVKLCNGQKSLSTIELELSKKWDKKDVQKLLNLFIENEIIMSSHNMTKLFSIMSNNPTPFSPHLSSRRIKQLVINVKKKIICESNLKSTSKIIVPVNKTSFVNTLLSKRKSTRSYSGESITEEILSSLLWAGYGLQGDQGDFYRRTVPSAGALYPIVLSLILLKDCGSLVRGVYDIKFTIKTIIFDLIHTNPDSYFVAFSEPEIIQESIGVIVMQGNYDRSAEKYGNRSFRYLSIEIGHIAQNINLFCQEHGIGTVEIGGFKEYCIEKLIESKKGYSPIHTIVFGIPSKISAKTKTKQLETIVKFPEKTDILKIPYTVIYGRTEGTNDVWAAGKDFNMTIAGKKMLSEFSEWNSWCMQKNISLKLKFSQIPEKNRLAPIRIVSYHKNQYREIAFPFRKFNENQQYQWIKAENLKNEQDIKYILADSVLFPYRSSLCPYTVSMSSGCAAHTEKQKAIIHAVYELIERDSFMIMWLNKLVTPRITIASLPKKLQIRIQQIQRLGFEILIKEISIGIAPVIFIPVKSSTHNVLTCGIASSGNPEEAINSALSEVELFIIDFLNNLKSGFVDKQRMKPKNVKSLSDHEKLFQQEKYIKQADFLFQSSGSISLSALQSRYERIVSSEITIIQRIFELGFEVYIVDATDWKKEYSILEHRYVVRIIIPGLIPLSFGYHTEPLGMSRIFKSPVDAGYLVSEKRYSEINRLPHPLN